MHWISQNVILPLAALLLAPALTAMAAMLVRWLKSGGDLARERAAAVKDDRLRTFLQWVILSAQNTLPKLATEVTGDDKKRWVLDQVKRHFPGVPADVASHAIEGVLAELKSDWAAPMLGKGLLSGEPIKWPPPAATLPDLVAPLRAPSTEPPPGGRIVGPLRPPSIP